jgi:hypothetical protein
MIEQLTAMPTYEAYKDSGVEWMGDIPAQNVGRNKRSGATGMVVSKLVKVRPLPCEKGKCR